MIRLNFKVDNIETTIQIYDQLQITRSSDEYGTFSSVVGLGPVFLAPNTNYFFENDPTGTADSWYKFRYNLSTISGVSSDWSDAFQGDHGYLYYDPLYPPEVAYSDTDSSIVKRIRLLIGDTVRLDREYGEEYTANIMSDNRTYKLEEKGWPANVRMNNITYNNIINPTVNGYKYLKFQSDISTPTTVSGIEHSVDVWVYRFRWSDKEIMESYDSCYPPAPLNTINCTSEVYMLQTSIDILSSELWTDLTDDGVKVTDDRTQYDPTPGLSGREKLLALLRRRLDGAIKSLTLVGITGVLID